jgi:hypothetical protein
LFKESPDILELNAALALETSDPEKPKCRKKTPSTKISRKKQKRHHLKG